MSLKSRISDRTPRFSRGPPIDSRAPPRSGAQRVRNWVRRSVSFRTPHGAAIEWVEFSCLQTSVYRLISMRRVSSTICRFAPVCRQQMLTPLSGPGAAPGHPHRRKWITRLAAASSPTGRERGRGPGGRGPPGTAPRRAGWRRSPAPIPTAHRVSRGPGWPWGSWG